MKTHLPPIQYYRFNKFGRKAVDEHLKAHGTDLPSDRTWPTLQRVLAEFFPTTGQLSREEVVDMFGEFQTVRDYLVWWVAGKNIFLFSDELVAAFKRTDVEDVPASLLKLPYSAFYFKFGNRTNIQTVPSPIRYLDGAYIYQQPWGLSVQCTQCSEDCTVGSSGLGFYIDFTQVQTVGEALERGLKMQAADITKHTQDAAGYGDGHAFMQDTEEQRRKMFEYGLPVYREVTKLIANGLAYVLYERGSIKEDWLGAPGKLVGKLENAHTPKEKHRNESKLLTLGFSKVHLCAPVLETDDEPTPSGRELKPHWRRGHWRHQPYGPGLSMIRLVWIRPTIVRRDKGEPEQGHVYLGGN